MSPFFKKYKSGLLIGFVAALINSTDVQAQKSSMQVQALRCEYLTNPLGIDKTAPRLSWIVTSDERSKRQTAYQIIAASTKENLNERSADLWNTQKVPSATQKQLAYKGKPLPARAYCYWKVRVWDEGGQVSDWSEPSFWSMGLLQPSDWKGAWIGEAPLPLRHWTKGPRAISHSGFHTVFATRPDTALSVVLDLGRVQAVDAVRLYPASPTGSRYNGYLFPVRFYIEASTDKLFQNPIRILDQTAGDVPNPDTQALYLPVTPAKARYVRLTATRLSESVFNKGRYAFALGEMQILSGGKNKANGAAVISNEAIESEEWGWSRKRLTDGVLKKKELPPLLNPPMTPSPLLRKTFTVQAFPLKRAVLYVSALGLAEVTLNGKKAGSAVLAPEWTDYQTRVQYQTYDVTDAVTGGENVLAAVLADGWYIGPVFAYAARSAYGLNRRLRAQLELHYENGQVQTVATDGSWKLYTDGPLRSASLYNGEVVDGSKDVPGWQVAGFDDRSWKRAAVDRTQTVLLSAQPNEPIKVVEQLPYASVKKLGDHTYVYDMGQNMVGWCRLTIPNYTGDSIRVRYAEMLNEDSSIYTDNLRAAQQTDRYSGPAQADVVWAPRFTYHGFRYVEVTGLPDPLPPAHLVGEVVASAAPTTGAFSCSSNDLNRLWKNIWWTQRGNMHGVPTDCPQRDERAGWMGDAQVFSETGMFNMDMAAFFSKWVRDIRDSQSPEGAYADISPVIRYGRWYSAPGWADAGVVVPWRLYEYYGDTAILRSHFRSVCRYIDYINALNKDYIWKNSTGNAYGDWLNGNTIIGTDYPKTGGAVPAAVYATAFYAYSTGLVAKMAAVLHEPTAAQKYGSLHKNIVAAFNKNFVDGEGRIEGDTQAGYALALSFGLLPQAVEQKAAAHLAEAVRRYDNRVSTGIQSTIRMMNSLSRFGYSGLAYTLLESDRFPSWLYSIRQGATTIWERWDGYVRGRGFQDVGMNSFNHYAIGAVGEWMYKSILGIRPDSASPGFNRFIIQPEPGGSLQWARGSYQSINGLIATDWARSDAAFTLKVTVPANTTAVVRLPRLFQNATLTESTKSIAIGNGILNYEELNGEHTVTIGSGAYTFLLTRQD